MPQSHKIYPHHLKNNIKNRKIKYSPPKIINPSHKIPKQNRNTPKVAKTPPHLSIFIFLYIFIYIPQISEIHQKSPLFIFQQSYTRMGCITHRDKQLEGDIKVKNKAQKKVLLKFWPLELELLKLLFDNLANRCRNDLVTREIFDIFFHASGLIGEIIFIKFDSIKNGTICFQEFIQAFELMTKGTRRQRADVLFQIYDIQKTGSIKYSQLLKILFSYPKEYLNQMLLAESFLKFLGESQLSYYFGTTLNKIQERNIVQEESSILLDEKQGFSSSILVKVSHEAEPNITNEQKKEEIEEFKKSNINDSLRMRSSKSIRQKKQKKDTESMVLSIESLKKNRKNVRISSNVSTLTKKYATFLFQSYSLDKDKDEFSKENFFKLLQDHPALFNVYLSGFHTYIWQTTDGQPHFLSISSHIEGEAQETSQTNKDKVYLKLIRQTLFVFNNQKSKKPQAIITLQGLNVMKIQQDNSYGFLIKHRDGLFPVKEYYFKSKEQQQEWLNQLSEFKEDSFHDKFIMLQRIGGGNYSNVYKGRDRETNKLVAIKMIQNYKLSSNEKEVIKRQCDILMRCHHPNIIKFHGEYKTKNELYIITELMTQGDLFEYTKKNIFLQEYEAAAIFRQLVDAILYVNEDLGIIHRDLKPQNVMIIMNEEKKRVNKIKLIDFGFGVYHDKLADLPIKEKYAGTPGFVAPEVYMCQDYDEKLDTFSLGIILYFMLSGYLPFQSNFIHQIQDLTKNCNFSLVNVHWSNISDNAKDLIYKTLTFKDTRITTREVAEHPWLTQAQTLKERIGMNKKKKTGSTRH